jgi:predicted RNase H-like HicB family nuclease
MRNYFAVVHKEEDSAFGIYFPDLRGCFSAGDTEDEALANARIALRLYAEDAEDLPEPRGAADLRQDEEVRKELDQGAFLIVVPVVIADRKERYNLMLDRSLVSAADQEAKVAGVNRSEFVAQALARHLKSTSGAVVMSRPKTRTTKASRAKRKAYA